MAVKAMQCGEDVTVIILICQTRQPKRQSLKFKVLPQLHSILRNEYGDVHQKYSVIPSR